MRGTLSTDDFATIGLLGKKVANNDDDTKQQLMQIFTDATMMKTMTASIISLNDRYRFQASV